MTAATCQRAVLLTLAGLSASPWSCGCAVPAAPAPEPATAPELAPEPTHSSRVRRQSLNPRTTKAQNRMAHLITSLSVSGYGSSAASGTASFYMPGTTVPAVVFSDDTMLTPIGSSVALDVSGRSVLPVYTASPLRVIIRAASGATLQDVTRIDGDRAELVQISNASTTATDLNSFITTIQGSTGGIDAKFLDAGPGAVPRPIQAKFSEVQLSVKDFGAVGNGIVDDTTSIQAGINRAATLGGAAVYLPPGVYNTSSALTWTAAGIELRGAGQFISKIRNTNPTANAITVTGNAAVIRNLSVTHASTSSGTAISLGSAAGTHVLDNVAASLHATALSSAYYTYASNSTFLNDPASVASAVNLTAGDTVMIGGGVSSTAGAGITTSARLFLHDTNVSGGTVGIDLTGTAAMFAYGVISTGITAALRTSATATQIFHAGCYWNGTVTDQRTGAPVNYVLAGAGNVTPLPAQADVIRVEQQTGGVVTTINNITPIGFGRTFTLICTNTSAGASTFTFGTNYVLSAAVTPAAGNRVALYLYYDPRTSKVYESGRGPTAN